MIMKTDTKVETLDTILYDLNVLARTYQINVAEQDDAYKDTFQRLNKQIAALKAEFAAHDGKMRIALDNGDRATRQALFLRKPEILRELAFAKKEMIEAQIAQQKTLLECYAGKYRYESSLKLKRANDLLEAMTKVRDQCHTAFMVAQGAEGNIKRHLGSLGADLERAQDELKAAMKPTEFESL